ncbi:MAG TPA: M20/M25/M40 family metallo-hydrolase [Polyangiaceae bacterium]|nr:M20/M25/M40 family metallo-hydrolase [Polyangiaceae bacterium]
MTDTGVNKAAEHAVSAWPRPLERLKGYLQYPAISCDPAHHGDVRALAARIAADLKNEFGFESRVLELKGALPVVTAERRSKNANAPTLLIYGHLDLQPVKGEPWTSPPHEPQIRDGRLYARGAADDMGGWVSHLAAVEAWLNTAGDLPLHVKFVIEAEEEIGSPNLEAYMDQFPEAFTADAMVLTDCENPSTDIPGLTVSLRGIYEVELSCYALTADVHSGLWGNMAPDAGTSLIKLLSRIIDDDGRLNLGRQQAPAQWRTEAAAVPITDAVIRQGAHLRGDTSPLPTLGLPAVEWLWRQPAVTVLSTTFPRATEHKNALREKASAVLSIRIAPGQTREQMRQLLEEALLKDPPGGVKVELTDRGGGSESWLYQPKGPAFAAADRAYEKAWGRKLLAVGVGGSIPFVALFGRRYAQLPLILNGVMDPQTGAHGPDESLSLEVFKKAILANVYLMDELSRVDFA